VRTFSRLPGLGTPAALQRLDRVWKSFPRRREVPALPLTSVPPHLLPGPPVLVADAETVPDLTPVSGNLVKIWSSDGGEQLGDGPRVPRHPGDAPVPAPAPDPHRARLVADGLHRPRDGTG